MFINYHKLYKIKKSLLIFTITLLPIFSFSQSQIGFFVGSNASSISDGFIKSGYIGSNSFSVHFGGLYETKLNDKISFRPKAIFSKQGDRESFEENIQYETTYINIPINFKFFNKPYVLAGPQIGFLIETIKKNIDFGELEKLDYGLNLGVGIDLSNFFIEFNIYQGLKSFITVETDKIDLNATNTVIQLSFGYNFDL